jgi:excisionase family DNA binding protein
MQNNVLIQNLHPEDLKRLIEKTIENCLQSLPKNEPESNGYLTRQETSKLLRISLPTLNELTKKGVLKGYRIGSRVLYRHSEVENSLSEIQTQKYRRA